ncbi:MAG: trypsin-like peptidase domain-containing protein, partial [Acidimicrobiales bacterium]|nr:trypsin-like peptidase domain-containing protein [Acidimicrobiales bacterium]
MSFGLPTRAAWRRTAREIGFAAGGLALGLVFGAAVLMATGRNDVETRLPLEVLAATAPAEPGAVSGPDAVESGHDGGAIDPVPIDSVPIDAVPIDAVPIDAATVDQAGVFRAKVWACSGRSFGTAFVTERGVLTAAHVIEGAAVVTLDNGPAPLEVRDPPLDHEGEVAIGTAAVLERARVTDGLDAALLAAEPAAGAQAVYPVREAEVAVGESVALVGHPAGGRREVRIGGVVGYGDGEVFGVEAERIMIVSVAADPGFSGGPVLDATGNAVAIIIGVETNTQT